MKDSCDALVISEIAYAENDKLITVLNAEHGQMSMIAKGARSPRSKMGALCRPFTYANFEYYQKSGKRWISGGEINNTFFGTNFDIASFALASYIVRLAQEITGEGEPCKRILRTTLNTLYAIENKLAPLPLIKSAYEIFAADESGFSPDTSACCECSATACDMGFWLDVMNGQVICADCQSKKSGAVPLPPTDELMTKNILIPMDNSALDAWRYVSGAPLKRIFSFSVENPTSQLYLERASETYILNHLERSFEALDFYHTVKE